MKKKKKGKRKTLISSQDAKYCCFDRLLITLFTLSKIGRDILLTFRRRRRGMYKKKCFDLCVSLSLTLDAEEYQNFRQLNKPNFSIFVECQNLIPLGKSHRPKRMNGGMLTLLHLLFTKVNQKMMKPAMNFIDNTCYKFKFKRKSSYQTTGKSRKRSSLQGVYRKTEMKNRDLIRTFSKRERENSVPFT